jgi:hypothetical protein
MAHRDGNFVLVSSGHKNLRILAARGRKQAKSRELQRAAAKSALELNPGTHVEDMEIQGGSLRKQFGIWGEIAAESSGQGEQDW